MLLPCYPFSSLPRFDGPLLAISFSSRAIGEGNEKGRERSVSQEGISRFEVEVKGDGRTFLTTRKRPSPPGTRSPTTSRQPPTVHPQYKVRVEHLASHHARKAEGGQARKGKPAYDALEAVNDTRRIRRGAAEPTCSKCLRRRSGTCCPACKSQKEAGGRVGSVEKRSRTKAGERGKQVTARERLDEHTQRSERVVEETHL